MGAAIGALLIWFLILAIFGGGNSSKSKQDYSAFGMKANNPGMTMGEAEYFTRKKK